MSDVYDLIEANVKTFFDSIERTDDWTFTCTADDLQTLGWIPVLCDVARQEEANAA